MHFVVKVFPEIFIKSMPVRKRMIRQLRDNLRTLLERLSVEIDVQRDWEKLEITAPGADEDTVSRVAEVLAHTPGIGNFSLVHAYPLGDLEDIFQKTLIHWREARAGKSFCVRVKRHGQHAFTSTEVER